MSSETMNFQIGRQVVDAIERLGVSHVVWLPDSTLGA